jgi:hypothetical protein
MVTDLLVPERGYTAGSPGKAQVLVPVLFTQVIPLLFKVQPDGSEALSLKANASPPASWLNVIALQGAVKLRGVQVETPLAFRVKFARPVKSKFVFEAAGVVALTIVIEPVGA